MTSDRSKPSLLRFLWVALAALLSGPLALVLAYPADATAASGSFYLEPFAGNGHTGLPVPGPASSSPTLPATSDVVDADGNVYVAEGHYVLKVTPSGTLSVFAGDGSTGTPHWGSATATPVNPQGLAIGPDGALYIADSDGWIDKVSPAGYLWVVAGKGGAMCGTPTPGPASSSQMCPSAVAFDSAGNMFIGTGNGYVLKVDPSDTLSVFAGNGQGGDPVAGPATSSPLLVYGLAIDAQNNVYIADPNYYVLKVTPSGTLSVYAGTAGSGTPQDGPATSAHISPRNVAVDSAGDLFIDDTHGYVEKVDTGGNLNVIGGNGVYGTAVEGWATSSPIYEPMGVTVDVAGNVYVAQSSGSVVRLFQPKPLAWGAGTGTGTLTVTSYQTTKYQLAVSGGTGGNSFTMVKNSTTPSGVVISPSGLVTVNVAMNNTNLVTGRSVQFRVVDSGGETYAGTLNLRIQPGAIAFSTAPNLNALGGSAYVGRSWAPRRIRTIRGWSTPSGDKFALIAGQFPAGMHLARLGVYDGQQSVAYWGTPTRAGVFSFELSAVDAKHHATRRWFTFTVHR